MAQTMATAQIQPLRILENNVLLKHSHIHSLRCCLWLLSMAELSCCNKNSMTHKARNIYYLSLARKSVITPGLRLPGERQEGRKDLKLQGREKIKVPKGRMESKEGREGKIDTDI